MATSLPEPEVSSPGVTKPRQLPLDLLHPVGRTRDELIITPSNALAVSLVDRWPDWVAPVMVLAGPPGSGKSHLASIWAEKAEATSLSANAISAFLDKGTAPCNLLIDGAGEEPLDETALFHLINSVRQSGHFLLITSRRWPSQWPVKLADLSSRLKSAPVTEISEPDDALLAGVITKLFADRQITIDPSIVSYLVSRIERSLATAQDVVSRIDRAALETRSRITRPLAAQVITAMDAGQSSFDL